MDTISPHLHHQTVKSIIEIEEVNWNRLVMVWRACLAML
jgi:hypothetical protein